MSGGIIAKKLYVTEGEEPMEVTKRLHQSGDGSYAEVVVLDIDHAPVVAQAIHDIKSTYGLDVSVHEKSKSLIKFGNNSAVRNTKVPVMTLASSSAIEPQVATNIVDSISTDDASASGQVLVEGHTVSGNDLTFVVQYVTLDGQNRVALTTPLRDMVRIRKITDPTLTDSENVALTPTSIAVDSTIYGYDDTGVSLVSGVPDDLTQVHCTMDSNAGSSGKGATSIAATDFYVILGLNLSVNLKNNAIVDFRLEEKFWSAPLKDYISRISKITLDTAASPSAIFTFPVAVVIPKNHDVRMTAISNVSNVDVEVTAGMFGVLAKVVTNE